jgi:uncharacterized membrane protein YgcG
VGVRAFVRGLLAALILALAALPLAAAEEILDFLSEVEVGADGSFLVIETIRVRSEGIDIRRGIYRDFPVTFTDAEGRTARTGFELVSASRDGQEEGTRIEAGGTFVRVYLGRAEVMLDPGIHTYVLTYRTDRQVRFFDDHDEVYWNATGTEWLFPIRSATAVIRLPEGARAGDVAFYTGPFGSRAQEARAEVSADGQSVTFVTTRPLGAREGLSVVVALDKGVILPPTAAQRRAWFLRDHLAGLIAAGGAALVFLYYLLAWLRIGRDPPKDVVVPRWDLPQGVSPALAHYVWNRGLKGQGFPAISASALNLAVGGYVEMDEIGRDVTLRRTGKPRGSGAFPVGEALLLDRIEARDNGFAISKSNGTSVAALGQAFRQAMEREHRNVYYRHNRGWIGVGVALTLAVIAAILFLGRPAAASLAALPPVLIGGGILTSMALRIARSRGQGLGQKLGLAVFLFMLVLFAVNSGLLAAARAALWLQDPLLVGALASLLLVNLMFFALLGAPTPLGSQREAEVEGLRRYLSVAEEDRMNMAGAPAMSPSHYETLLPYAVALDVEKPWSRAFQTWLATAVAAGTVAAGAYAPGWYHGADRPGSSVGERLSGIGGSLSDSLTGALPAPQSSSSGFSCGGSSGGGSSGGGGGGGGGGGW